MNERRIPAMTKWPFYVADLVLLGLAILILGHYPHPLPPWPATLIVVCVAAGGVLSVWPYRIEYQTVAKVAESGELTTAVHEIRNLQTIAEQIRLATGQWQGVQDHSAKTVSVAKEISERMAAEARAFTDFMQKANETEKATLRLEVEKLRRSESQWLQVLVHLLDHVFALYQAGARSGQPNLQEQLGHFQEACRDIARRVGLTPFEATPDDSFDPEKHQVADGQPQPPPDARVAQTLASGYTFQGQLLRRSIVSLKPTVSSEFEQAQTAPGEPSAVGSKSSQTESLLADRSAMSLSTSDEEATVETGQEFRLEAEGLAAGDAPELQP